MADSKPENRLFKRIWGMLPALILILLIIVIVVMSSQISSESERVKAEKLSALHKERPPVNVVVLDMVPTRIQDRINLPAQVEAWIDLRILAEVSGKVMQVLVKEGDFVNKGDPVALLDTRDYENALSSARAEYELAQKDLTRTEDLFNEKLITRAQLDIDLTRVESLRAAVSNAELGLERCSITAPISGIINRLDAKEGLYLSVLDPVAVVLDISRVKVSVGIPESEVDDVRKLVNFDIVIDALNGRTVKGKKNFLSRSPETFAHLYKLEIEVMNPNGAILPGMFARVNIVKKEVKAGMSVPLYSVISRGDEQFVFTEKDGRVSVRLVETGILEGWKMEISKGLAQGDRVVVIGHRSVDEGQEVNVVRTVSDPEDLFK